MCIASSSIREDLKTKMGLPFRPVEPCADCSACVDDVSVGISDDDDVHSCCFYDVSYYDDHDDNVFSVTYSSPAFSDRHVDSYLCNTLPDYTPLSHASDGTAFCVVYVDALHTMCKHNDNNRATGGCIACEAHSDGHCVFGRSGCSCQTDLYR